MMKDTASWVTFRYLFEHSSQEKQASFIDYLSEKDRASLEGSYSIEANPFQNLGNLSARLQQIHYSWFIPFLESFSAGDKRCFIATFDPPVAAKLSFHFGLSSPPPPLSPLAKRYLQAKLFSWATAGSQDFIPLALLPPHPLNPLLSLTKSELQQVVNLLGLRDLATEIKHVVQRQQMKKIQSVLSPQEKETLKKLLINPPLPVFPSLNLDQWNGDEAVLKKILHHRGFNRLSKALFGCHQALMWHLCRLLDTGRAKILRRFCTDVRKPSLKETLIEQAVETIATIRDAYE